MSRADEILIPSRAVGASPVPATYAVHHSGWMPVIHHPERTDRATPYVTFPQPEEFRRKVKPTAYEAMEYARRVIHYRKVMAAEKRRHLEILSSPHWHFALAAE